MEKENEEKQHKKRTNRKRKEQLESKKMEKKRGNRREREGEGDDNKQTIINRTVILKLSPNESEGEGGGCGFLNSREFLVF